MALFADAKKQVANKSLKQISGEIIDYYKEASLEHLDKLKDLKKTNFDLGVTHFNMGNFYDAILRFKIIIKFAGLNYPEANYYLGRCYLEKGDFDKAIKYLEKYQELSHNNFSKEVVYCLDIAHKRYDNIESIPDSIIAHNFDIVQPLYEKDLAVIYEGNPPERILYSRVHSYVSKGKKPFGNDILDLACTTGIIGRLAKESKIVNSIEGVDLSDKMIEHCKSLKQDDIAVYDKLHKCSIDDYLASNKKKSFDVVVASGLLHYHPQFRDLLKKISKITHKNSIIAFNIKLTEQEDKDFIFDYTFEEFRYQKKFILESIKKAKWKIALEEDLKFYDDTPGLLFILEK